MVITVYTKTYSSFISGFKKKEKQSFPQHTIPATVSKCCDFEATSILYKSGGAETDMIKGNLNFEDV